MRALPPLLLLLPLLACTARALSPAAPLTWLRTAAESAGASLASLRHCTGEDGAMQTLFPDSPAHVFQACRGGSSAGDGGTAPLQVSLVDESGECSVTAECALDTYVQFPPQQPHCAVFGSRVIFATNGLPQFKPCAGRKFGLAIPAAGAPEPDTSTVQGLAQRLGAAVGASMRGHLPPSGRYAVQLGTVA